MVYVDIHRHRCICIHIQSIYFTNNAGSIFVARTWTLDSARESICLICLFLLLIAFINAFMNPLVFMLRVVLCLSRSFSHSPIKNLKKFSCEFNLLIATWVVPHTTVCNKLKACFLAHPWMDKFCFSHFYELKMLNFASLVEPGEHEHFLLKSEF